MNKSKIKIKMALFELLKIKTFDEISITEISDTAKIHRVTFYTYYHDKYDLVSEIINDYKKEIVIPYSNIESEEQVLNYLELSGRAFVDFCYNHKDLIKLLNHDGNQMIVFIIQNYATDYLTNELTKQSKKYSFKYSPKSIATFTVYGFSKVVFDWTSNSNNVSSEQFLNSIEQLVKDITVSHLLIK